LKEKERKKMSVFEGMYIVKKIMGYKTEKEKEKVVLSFVLSILALYLNLFFSGENAENKTKKCRFFFLLCVVVLL